MHTGESLSFTPSKELVGSIVAAVNAVGKLADHAVAPPTAHGNGNGNVQYQAGKMTFMWCHKHIRPEYAEIIDNFFDMYGYTINMHRNISAYTNNRSKWNYVKTQNADLRVFAPARYEEEIKGIFNSGVRIWHDYANFANYSVTNS